MSDFLRVLLVEDNPGDADLIMELLPAHGPVLFEIECVARLSEALERVISNRFDIILLDLSLPDSDGLETLRAMRRHGAELPIVVLTGNNDERMALSAIQEGAQDYLVKGLPDKSQLARAIKYAVERKQAEERVRTSEAKYRQLHESMMDAFCRIDLSGRIIESNGVFMNMLGYKADELYRLAFDEITPPQWHASESAIIDQQVLLRGYSDVYEKEFLRKDGTLVTAELRMVLLKDKNGHPAGMWAIIRDITGRKRAEASLKSSEEFIRSILYSVDESFVVIDRNYRIISANRAFCEQSGMSLEEVTGRYCYNISHHMPQPCSEVYQDCACKRTFETGEPAVFVETITGKSGKQIHLEKKTYAMKDESGNINSVIEIVNDITEKINLENQVRQSQKMEAIGTLAGGIAHDFNNILTAILGYGHIIKTKMGPDDPLRLYIEHMLEGADRAAHLTKDLLIFSRKQISEKKPVDLNDIISKVEKFLVRIIGEDIKCRVMLQKDPIVVHADLHQLEQVLMNLATNARDAMVKGGDLIISAEQISVDNDFVLMHGFGNTGSYALLTISDTGEGMDEKTREKIFEPFFTTKAVGKGTGLGLAVAYGIIKEHDGFINVYSEPGKGTTFKIYLPVIKSDVCEENKVLVEEPLVHGSETILLAEDDAPTRQLISIVLKKWGYTVIEANNGKDAVKKFMENKDTINLLLFDLIMPEMNGNEANEAIKAIRSGVKAIYLSGYAPDIIRLKVLPESGVELIYKPILPNTLLKKVRSLLDGI